MQARLILFPRNAILSGDEGISEGTVDNRHIPDELKIFVVTHKPVITPNDPFYMPIHAGAATRKDFGILRDDTGQNISLKNGIYSELTAHYWIWKNVACKYIGLVHYRRFFAGRQETILHLGKRIGSGQDILGTMTNNKFLVADPVKFFCGNFPESVEQQYVSAHGFEVLPARRAVADFCKDYLDAFDFVMRNNVLYAFNLLVTTKEIFDRYCSWVFSLLSLIENMVQLGSRTVYQTRVLAFLSERLFTVWMAHNQADLEVETRAHVFYGGI